MPRNRNTNPYGVTPAVRQADQSGKRGSGRTTFSSARSYSYSNAMPFLDDRRTVGFDGRRRYRIKTTYNPQTGMTTNRKIKPPIPNRGPGRSAAQRHSQRVGAARWRRNSWG